MKKTIEERLAYVEDRLAIHDVLNRYTHAIDRHDREMFMSVYHPDAVLDHGIVIGSPKTVFDFLEPRYHQNNRTHAHIICNHLCEIDGDTAHTETYVVTMGLAKDGTRIMVNCARYIDRLERRDGEWRIALRRIMTDTRGQLPVMGDQLAEGRWDKTDASYMRPLALPPERAALVAEDGR